tara:strand:+ start:955 stop:1164 length:210 start_codon:yes stop_codon:yes gene_type:complete
MGTIMYAIIVLIINLFATTVLATGGLGLTYAYYITDLDMHGIFAWVSPLMIPLAFGMGVVSIREFRESV